MHYIGLDFETFSDVNLPMKGLHNYINGALFTPLMASISHKHLGERTFDFVLDPNAREEFEEYVLNLYRTDKNARIVAHNAGFERAVLAQMGLGEVSDMVVDSASYARMLGAGEKLEVASRQLTSSPKLAAGKDLIMTFCVPNEWNEGKPPTPLKILQRHSEDWLTFIDYCEVDAKGSREIAELAEQLYNSCDVPFLLQREDSFEYLTWEQNQVGWHIDRLLVERMSNRAWANTLIEEKKFFLNNDVQLNFNAPVQLKKYCTDRGVKVTSLDKYNLPLVLERVEKEIVKHTIDGLDTTKLEEVKRMLECKLELGGSSLSKLGRILELSGEDDQLRDQYVHSGAGQTFRTAAKGVQMQNIPKLAGNIRDMETIYDYEVEWSNTDMVKQLRQVFTASHKEGRLLVGDFSAVESRGLAYLAGEEWKLDAYREGLDVYKVLVTRFEGYEHLTVDDVTAELRPRGKYSELSCGYQASAKAVQDFMFRLGFIVSLDESGQNVIDWRKANPQITQFWKDLDNLLRQAVETAKPTSLKLAYGQKIVIKPFLLDSIQEQHPGAVSLMIQIWDNGVALVNRVIHGCYMKGNAICYYKPVEQHNGGPLWEKLNKTQTQKQKKNVLNTVYGGKLAGILTQSLCRELFFDSMLDLQNMLKHVPNARMVGQFHDEIVVDWWPGEVSEEDVKSMMNHAMSQCRLKDFPLTADIKSAYRYIK